MCQDAYERLPRSRPAGSKETEGMDARFKNGTWVPHRFHVQSYLGCLCASNIATSLQNMLQPGAPQTVTCMWITLQFSSVAQLSPTLCDPMDYSTPGFPVHHHLLELIQAHVHLVSDAIQPSHPLSFNHLRSLLTCRFGFRGSWKGLRAGVSNKPPDEATAKGLWTTQGTARPQPWGGGRVGVGSQQSSPVDLCSTTNMKWCTVSGVIFYGSSSPQLHPSLPSHCTGNLHNSKQHKSLLIKVLQRNWNGNKKQGWLCEHSSYWSVCIITVSFKHKKKYIICCLSQWVDENVWFTLFYLLLKCCLDR